MVAMTLGGQLMAAVLGTVVLATIGFAIVGIQAVYDGHKEAQWQREHGDKLEEETKRNRWLNLARLSDKVFLLEEMLKKCGIEHAVAKIDRIVSEVDYDKRYNTSQKLDSKCTVYAVSSICGGLGSTKEAQAEVNVDFAKYELLRKQQLREQLEKEISTDH